MTDGKLAFFENYRIRRQFDEARGVWLFSVVDILQVLLQQPDFKAARKYWNKLKERLRKEGSQLVTNCHQLKLEAADGKKVVSGENFLAPQDSAARLGKRQGNES